MSRDPATRSDIHTAQRPYGSIGTLHAASEVFARAMHVLTVENETLRKEITKANHSRVVPIRR